jgi:UDP-glucose 4-epimerase
MKNNPINNSTILVTGGAGFVGSWVVEKLLPYEPAEIIILDNLLRGSLENMESFSNNPRVTFVNGDIRDKDLVDELMSRSNYCFHLAALRITRCAENPAEAFEVMAKATFNILEAAKKFNIKKIIYSSTASVYGLAQHFPTPESDNPYDNKTFYGAAKIFGEQMLKSYHDMYGIRYVALRYFNIYGPRMDREGKYTEVMIKWLDCIRDKKAPLIFGDGNDSMDFIHVGDVARANVQALISDASDEAFNIGCSRETSLKELLQMMLAVNNSTLVPEHRPANKVNPVSRRLADISKAQKQLGFNPEIRLEDGLRDLSSWYFNKQTSIV